LHAENPRSQIKREVIATVLGNRLEDVDPELDRFERDRRFGDVPLVVGCQHPAILARGNARMARGVP
jgi:hypothetical protein